MTSGRVARVTYTCDGHKKLRHNRKWLDGYVTLQGNHVILQNEERVAVVCRKQLDRDALTALLGGDETVLTKPSILVVLDAFISEENVRPGTNAGASVPAQPSKQLPRSVRRPAIVLRPNPAFFNGEAGANEREPAPVDRVAEAECPAPESSILHAPCDPPEAAPTIASPAAEPSSADALPAAPEAAVVSPTMDGPPAAPALKPPSTALKRKFKAPEIHQAPSGAPGKACLRVPSLSECANCQRLVTLPSTFASGEAYLSSLRAALTEEIMLR